MARGGRALARALPAAVAGPRAPRARVTATLTPTARSFRTSTCACSPTGVTDTPTASSAPTHQVIDVSPARCSPYGRPTPSGSAWSATSTAGTAACTRCASARRRRLGAVPAAPRAGAPLQVRDPQPSDGAGATQGRPVRPAARASAVHRLRHSRDRRHALERPRVDGTTPAGGLAALAHFHLRGAPRLLAAGARWRVPRLPRAGASTGGTTSRKWASPTSS